MNEVRVVLWQDTKQIEEIKKIYAPNSTDGEFKTFVEIGKATGLNPFLREIWFVKYGNQASIFIGRDGYRKSAQAHTDYDYHLADAIYENDEFSVVNSEIKHNYNLKDRGAIKGAYCITKRKKSSKAHYVFVDFSEYTTKKSIWNDKPATMIKKVAESQCLRMAFQDMFAGTYDESEQWEEPKNVKTIIKEVEEVEEIEKLSDKENKTDLIFARSIGDKEGFEKFGEYIKLRFKRLSPETQKEILKITKAKKEELNIK